jgi:hypothetical protein
MISSLFTTLELIFVILMHLLEDKQALYLCCLVNRTWAHCGLALLWCALDYHQMVHLPGARRQFYANKVVSLQLHK